MRFHSRPQFLFSHSKAVSILILLILSPTRSLYAEEVTPVKKENPQLTEQTIYIPYQNLEAIFEKEGRGVFIPYKEFLEIWTRQVPGATEKKREKPPVDGVPVAIEYTGKVEGKVAVIEANLEIRGLKEGYSLVPLGVSHLSISGAEVLQAAGAGVSATTTETSASGSTPSAAFLITVPANLEKQEGSQLRTLVQQQAPSQSPSGEILSSTPTKASLAGPKPGTLAAILPGPGLYRFHLTLMLPVVEVPGGKYIEFKGPDAPVSRFTLDVPDKSVEFELTPTSAFSHQPGEGETTRLSAFFTGSEPIQILWKPARVEQARTALLFADLNERLTLMEGSTQCTSKLNLQVLLAGLEQVTLSLPSGSQVLSVSASNLRAWETQNTSEKQKVLIHFHSAIKDSVSLSVSYEVPAATTTTGERQIPMLIVEGAQRQSGHIAALVPPYLEIRPKQVTGLSQETLDAGTAGGQPAFAYRYLRVPYTLSFEISKTTPKVWTEVQSLVQIGLDKWVNLTRIQYDVKKAGVFRLDLNCPVGFTDPEIVEGDAPVSDYRVLGAEGQRHIEIELKELRSGAFNLLLRCEKPWTPPAPDQSVTETIPVFTPLGVDRIDGYLGVGVHESLAANIAGLGGGRPEDIRTLTGLPSADKGLPVPLTLGFRYRSEQAPPSVSFNRRKPRVSAEAQTLVEVREAFYELTTHLAYQVEYAGVDEFSFTAPTAIADLIQIEGPAIKEKTKEVKEDLATWKVTLQDKQTGKYELTLIYESPYATVNEATAASRAQFEVPRIVPLNVFRSTGLLSVVKSGNLDITPTPQGLEAIDNKELPERLRPPGTFLAFRYDRGTAEEKTPWRLEVAVERHAYMEIPTSVVNYADLHTVVNKEGHQVCLATYYLQNKRAQYLELELPEGAQLLSEIFVGDTGEQPAMRATDKKILIRLGSVEDPNASIPVQFAYEQSVPKAGMGILGSFKIQPPELSGTKILQTNWTLFLPEEYVYTHFDGQMTEAQRYRSGWYRWRRYLDWVVPQPGIGRPPVQTVYPHGVPGSGQQAAPSPKVTIVEEGQRFQLRRLDAPAPVTVRYRKVAWSLVFEMFTFLLAVLLGVFLVKHGKTKRLTYCLTAGILAVLISVLVTPRAAGPYQSFYMGVFCLAVVWGILALVACCPNRPWKHKPVPPVTPESTPLAPSPAEPPVLEEARSSVSGSDETEPKEEEEEEKKDA